MAATGVAANDTKIMLALIADRLALLLWQRTKDGAKGRNMPPRILDKILETKKEKTNMSFDNGSDFSGYWDKAVKERNHAKN